MRLFTIGFTQQTAETFFNVLRASGAARVLDTRVNNISQLSAFAKRDDLRFFLRALCGMDYAHRLDLAPTPEMFEAYRRDGQDWDDYARSFRELLVERRIEATLPRALADNAVLLCSERAASRCHRRLVAEYLGAKWGDVQITHL